MNYPFSQIVIIYNPNSTGDSKTNAQTLKSDLAKELPNTVEIQLVATERASHAEEIATEVATKYKNVLIVSSSGDGGYNEVVNGLLAANNPNAVTTVLPSGNANDHYEATSLRSIEDKILNPKIEAVDGIKVTGVKDGKPFTRHAHSYAGVGLTAYIGKKLTEATLNPINEKWLVAKYLFRFNGVTLKVSPDLRWHRYSSLVFGNIGRMSKVIKLARESDFDDGKMEVYELRTASTIRTIGMLIFGSTVGLQATAQLTELVFTPRHSIDMQFDGEVITLDEKQEVTVSIEANIIKTLL